jgi:hypothetical protein
MQVKGKMSKLLKKVKEVMGKSKGKGRVRRR